MNRGYPPELEEAEQRALFERRKAAGYGTDDRSKVADATVGFGLSGGGIRSATFSLGLFQALAQARLIRKIDFLSTVSGGGYFGTFLGRLFSRDESELTAAGANAGQPTVAQVEEIVANQHSPPIRWLRENGRYLSPNGSGDTMLGAAIILRNWSATQVVLATFLLMQLTAANFVRAFVDSALSFLERSQDSQLSGLAGFLHALSPGLPAGWVWWSPYILLPAAILAFGVIPLGWAGWLVPYKAERKEIGRGVPQVLVVILLVLVCGAVSFAEYVAGFDVPCVPGILALVLGTEAMVALLWAGLAFLLTSRVADQNAHALNWLSHALAKALSFALATLAFAVLDSFGQTVYACLKYRGVPSWKWLTLVASGAFALVAIGQKVPALFGDKRSHRQIRWPVVLITGIAGISLAWIVMVALAALAHGAAWQWRTPAGNPGQLIARFAFGDSAIPNRGPIAATVASADVSGSDSADESTGLSVSCLLLWSLVLLLLSITLGYSWPFLNQSSQQGLYNARLTRAYLGASNPRRWQGGGTSVSRVIDGDAISLADYAPHRSGGPLHFINVTVNETVDAKSQIEQRDRKGTGMAVGPCGVSVGVRHHAVWYSKDKQLLPPFYEPGRFQVFQDEERTTREDAERYGHKCKPISVEPLQLGQWVGISGAAVSTGVGAGTTLGLSLLAGILDVRLGYWWNSGIDPTTRDAQCDIGIVGRLFRRLAQIFPVQLYLLDEFTARFHGTARKQWYLSDGGHFENMAGYELIRRRARLIVICDGEQDADFKFQGLANLVLKARTDFGAEIEFFTPEELDNFVDPAVRPYIGTLDQLRRGRWSNEPVNDPATEELRLSIKGENERLSLAHAALARIRYIDDPLATKPPPQSILLYIKASLTGDEPADLTNYHKGHPDFPHQSTAEQFFDEAQWESYRKLGVHIGRMLFPADPTPGAHKWIPSSLDPTPLFGTPSPPPRASTREAKAGAKRA